MNEQAENDWSLFADWAEATDRDPLGCGAADLLVYARDIPAANSTLARKLRTITAKLGISPDRAHGAWPILEVSLIDALRLPRPLGWIPRWRHARDSFLLTLAAPVAQGGTDWGRTKISAVTADMVACDGPEQPVSIEGLNLGVAEVVAECPSCAVAEWMRLSLLGSWFFTTVIQDRVRNDDLPDAHEHDAWLHMSPGFGEGQRLVYSINEHGHRAIDTALTVGAIGKAIESRVRAVTQSPIEHEATTERESDEVRLHAEAALEDVIEMLDQACDAADQANARIAAILAESVAVITAIKKDQDKLGKAEGKQRRTH